MKKKTPKQVLPDGMTEKEVLAIIDHYENQTDEEAAAEDEAAFSGEKTTMIQIPVSLLGKVRKLIFQAAKAKRSKAA